MTIFETAAILGVFAWLPHLIKLIKAVFTRPEIRIITHRISEIGYTTFGPIINQRIAFSVRHRDIVISSIKIRLKHESGEEKILSWQGITQKLGQLTASEGGSVSWDKELSALAIRLTEKEIEERVIRFQEEAYYIKKENYESEIAKKWNYLKKTGRYDADKFLESEEMGTLYLFIKQWFSWKQGKYTLTFEIDSPEKFKLKDNSYEFTLNPLNIEQLESNIDFIQLSFEDLLKFFTEGYKPHNPKWNWAYPILGKTP